MHLGDIHTILRIERRRWEDEARRAAISRARRRGPGLRARTAGVLRALANRIETPPSPTPVDLHPLTRPRGRT